jgi:hypothetical protein
MDLKPQSIKLSDPNDISINLGKEDINCRSIRDGVTVSKKTRNGFPVIVYTKLAE